MPYDRKGVQLVSGVLRLEVLFVALHDTDILPDEGIELSARDAGCPLLNVLNKAINLLRLEFEVFEEVTGNLEERESVRGPKGA